MLAMVRTSRHNEKDRLTVSQSVSFLDSGTDGIPFCRFPHLLTRSLARWILPTTMEVRIIKIATCGL